MKKIIYVVILLILLTPIAGYASYVLNKKYTIQLVKEEYGYDDNYSLQVPLVVAIFPKKLKIAISHNKSDLKWDITLSHHNELDAMVNAKQIHGWRISLDESINDMNDLKEAQSTLMSVYQNGYIRGMNAEMLGSEKVLVASALAKYNIKHPNKQISTK